MSDLLGQLLPSCPLTEASSPVLSIFEQSYKAYVARNRCANNHLSKPLELLFGHFAHNFIKP